MTLSTAGDFIELTPRGAATIAVLRLNGRADLVEARYRSLRHILRIFAEADRAGRLLTLDHIEDLRFLPVVDTFHHFAHDVSAGRLKYKAVAPQLAAFAEHNLPTLRTIFASCQL
jgi:hypothetical protein